MDGTSSEQPSAAEHHEGLTVSLRILSPSLDPNHRLVLEKLPLSTTVEEVKELITPLVPNQPSPEDQRLIYRGRPLLGTTTTLQNILEPPLDQDITHTLHLVLPPSPQVSDNVYIGPDNALRYRHQPGRSPLAHASSTINTTGTTTGVQLTGQAGLTAQTLGTLNDLPPIQDPIPSVEHLATNFSTWQLLEQRQRRLEELERMRSMSAALATHLRNRGVDVSNNESNTQGPRPPSTNPMVPTPAPPAANMPVTVTHPLDASNLATMGPPLAVALARLASQIRVLELEVEQDRSQALATMSEIHRELHIISMPPSGQLPPETYQEVQSLLRRVETIMTRARQIHQSQSQLRQQQRQQQQQRLQQQRLGALTANANENQRFVASQQPSEYYLVTTSSGEQMLLTPPAPSTIPVEPETTLVFPNQRPEARMEVDAIGPAPNDILRNAVREAILNQQPVRNNNNDQVARNLRRFWLFMRLYFFCYLFTDSNTWERYLFAAFAAIIALFSESDFMNRLSSLTLQPVQRHLEGLIHGAPGPPPAGQHDAPINQSERHHESGSHNRLQQEPQGFRRIERAFALFIASLVPGLGERQVEVQVAAEEAARNARQQEQAARDEAAALNQGGNQAETAANQDEAQSPGVAEPEINPGQH